MASYRGDFDKIEVLMDSGPELAFAWGLGFRDIFWLGEVVFCLFGLECVLKHQNVSEGSTLPPAWVHHWWATSSLMDNTCQYFSWSCGKGKVTLERRYKKWISGGQTAWSRWAESWGWGMPGLSRKRRESGVPKNRCFWIVVLEKTLESPLDRKEIKLFNPKGNQSWIFIGRTDAEAPIIWPPDAKSWLIGKDPDAGKDWRQEEKGTGEDEMVGWYHWLNGHEFE